MNKKKLLIKFLDSIRDYEHESGHSMWNDDRDSEEIVDIFLNNPSHGDITLTDKQVYDMLRDAEDAFRQKPNSTVLNHFGLCTFMEIKYGIDENEMSSILGDRYSEDTHTFCKGFTQEEVYRDENEDLYFERADWCKERMKGFKEEKE